MVEKTTEFCHHGLGLLVSGAVVELTLVLRVESTTLSRLCMTLRLLRPPESLIVRPPGGGQVHRGRDGAARPELGTVVKLR